jgi:hypothetical protein
MLRCRSNYVSQAALQGDKSKAGSIVRVPAPYIESLVAGAIGEQSSGCVASSADLRDRIDRVTIDRAEIHIQLSPDLDSKRGPAPARH